MQVGSLFSGIGGLDLGLERAGMEVRWQCEIDPYCRGVLAHHWPGVRCYDDIRAIDESVESVDLVCGGFPCQPVSLAGKGLAQKDPRWLWPEFARVVGLVRPRYVLVENVPGLVRRGLCDVVGDLAAMGYDAEWQIVSAASVGAPHLRERLIVVAYPGGSRRREDTGSTHAHEGDQDGFAAQNDHLADGDGEGDRAGQVPAPLADPSRDVPGQSPAPGAERERAGTGGAGRRASDVEDTDGKPRLQWRSPTAGQAEGGRPWPDASGRGVRGIGEWFPESEVGRVADGVPGRVAQLRALGNAVVPQVAEFVGRLILEAEASAQACA